jgi:hypothetical protein
MLLNEFLKEHRTVQQMKSTAAKQEATIAEINRGTTAKGNSGSDCGSPKE